MTEQAQDSATGSAAGDPVNALLLGFAAQIDQLAGLIGGVPLPGADTGEHGVHLGELMGEVGSLVGELGDLLARLLSALIAVLEGVVDMLRATPAGTAPVATAYQRIPVTVAV